MARKDFEELAEHLADIVEAIRNKDLNDEFDAESLLPESWRRHPDAERQAIGWQIRELLRVFTAVKHIGADGKGLYRKDSVIPPRSPFDGGMRE